MLTQLISNSFKGPTASYSIFIGQMMNDLATATLKDLQDLAKFRNQLSAFNDKMEIIRRNYGRSRGLLQRFERNGLL